MNRKISAVAAVVLMLAVIICAALPAFAALAPTQDGVYEVSVKSTTLRRTRPLWATNTLFIPHC